MTGEDDQGLAARAVEALADIAATERLLAAERPQAADQIRTITTAATWEILKVLLTHRRQG